MKVCVVGDCNEVMWVKTETGGFTARSYRDDGTLAKIIAMLEAALTQARGELSGPVELSNFDDQALAALKEMRPRRGAVVNVNFAIEQGSTSPQTGGEVERYIGMQVRRDIDVYRARHYWQKTLEETPKEVLVEALSMALATGRYVEKTSNCCGCRCRTG